MFTGIIEEIGTIRSLTRPDDASADAVLTAVAPLAASDARHGDSIAVDGVCLTVTGIAGDELTFDVMPESLRRSTLGTLTAGSRVNLERALPAHGRLGGHVVQGHVDGTATLVSRTPGPRWDELTFTGPHALLRYVAEKGSIALNGVSLTITFVSDAAAGADAAAGQGTFGVSLIPTTLEATNLGDLTPGSPVNVEVDVLAKYTERLLAAAGSLPAAPLAGAGAASAPAAVTGLPAGSVQESAQPQEVGA